VSNWPQDWVLIVHTRYDSSNDNELVRLKNAANPSRIFFSTQAVPRNIYPELVAGADIGIAFYLPTHSTFTQENIHNMGLSSGKIAYYLMAGVPVIVNRWPSISKLIEGEGCGVVVECADEIGDAIKMINQRREDYHYNACEVFEKYLDPLPSLKQFIMHIDGL
jgi:glycosyltransferase involved in cell wall biosynthesis